jgi:hypothetical protein
LTRFFLTHPKKKHPNKMIKMLLTSNSSWLAEV